MMRARRLRPPPFALAVLLMLGCVQRGYVGFAKPKLYSNKSTRSTLATQSSKARKAVASQAGSTEPHQLFSMREAQSLQLRVSTVNEGATATAPDSVPAPAVPEAPIPTSLTPIGLFSESLEDATHAQAALEGTRLLYAGDLATEGPNARIFQVRMDVWVEPQRQDYLTYPYRWFDIYHGLRNYTKDYDVELHFSLPLICDPNELDPAEDPLVQIYSVSPRSENIRALEGAARASELALAAAASQGNVAAAAEYARRREEAFSELRKYPVVRGVIDSPTGFRFIISPRRRLVQRSALVRWIPGVSSYKLQRLLESRSYDLYANVLIRDAAAFESGRWAQPGACDPNGADAAVTAGAGAEGAPGAPAKKPADAEDAKREEKKRVPVQAVIPQLTVMSSASTDYDIGFLRLGYRGTSPPPELATVKSAADANAVFLKRRCEAVADWLVWPWQDRCPPKEEIEDWVRADCQAPEHAGTDKCTDKERRVVRGALAEALDRIETRYDGAREELGLPLAMWANYKQFGDARKHVLIPFAETYPPRLVRGYRPNGDDSLDYRVVRLGLPLYASGDRLPHPTARLDKERKQLILSWPGVDLTARSICVDTTDVAAATTCPTLRYAVTGPRHEGLYDISWFDAAKTQTLTVRERGGGNPLLAVVKHKKEGVKASIRPEISSAGKRVTIVLPGDHKGKAVTAITGISFGDTAGLNVVAKPTRVGATIAKWDIAADVPRDPPSERVDVRALVTLTDASQNQSQASIPVGEFVYKAFVRPY